MAIADPTPQDVLDQLKGSGEKELLRFITCGSVDDGKSTLIGRLLHEPGLLFEDQLAALVADSKRVGTQGGDLDLALLLDGLEAEREQGITIDVAYRYFTTGRRKFIVADTPGHEQYTRNMVTGASTADCAVVLVDARAGLLTQTRRHSHIVALLGIRHVVLAVNKIDLVEYSDERFRQIEAEYAAFAGQIGLPEVTSIPLSALRGDNVVTRSERTPWYSGPTLLEHLESVEVDTQRLQDEPLRIPVQWVNRPHADFRGYSGLIVSGTVRAGDAVILQPSGQRTMVERIVSYDGDLERAVAGQSVTVTLQDEIDISRGDVIASADEPPGVGDQFQATLLWMADDPLLRGRSYLMRLGTRTVTATVAPVRHKVNIDTLARVAADDLGLNDIGVCELELDRPIVFDRYETNRDMGGFVLIDRITNATVGAGMLDFELRRSQNVHWQALDVGKTARAKLNGHRGCVIWFTGLSGAGKSTIANLLECKLHSLGCHTCLLDGDNVRHGLNKDLGFTDADRVENIRRIAEVARLMVDAGLIVLVASISPFRSERRMARELVEEGEFVEVFVDTPLEVAEARDPKNLYAKARQGKIRNFTGIDSPYEPPEAPELRIGTTATSPAGAVELIHEALSARRIL